MIGNNKRRGKFASGTVRVIVFNGESNSGGVGENSRLNSTESATRTNTKILNNTTLTSFDSLLIGTNNLIGHTGLSSTGKHGWENEIANQVDAGIIDSPTYIVKTGQGGSLIADWSTGGTYYTTMKNRVDAALSLLSGSTIKLYWFFSLGINDALAAGGTADATWKTAVQAYFAQIRTVYGSTVPIIMTKFNDTMPTRYNDDMDSIASTDSYSKAVDCTGAPISTVSGFELNHWDYEGYKIVANRMIQTMLTYY